jgi:hypothetical protein
MVAMKATLRESRSSLAMASRALCFRQTLLQILASLCLEEPKIQEVEADICSAILGLMDDPPYEPIVAALGAVFWMCAWGTRRGRCVNGGRLAARLVMQGSDGIQQLHAVSKRRDAKLLQVLVRQTRENRLVYVILAEDRLVLAEAKAPQPDHNVHEGAHN